MLLFALPEALRAGEPVTANDPDPQRLPTLSVYNDDKFSRGQVLTMVAAKFPNFPDFTCDSWCYEVGWIFWTPALDGGKVALVTATGTTHTQ